ncbi:hypothetical protein BB28_22165 [Mycobacteroides chelonae CCUG 47445]|nr:hypothetical protein BB28_22165 [Mycobacteroides chelonae CCUG 47445]
MDLRGDLYEYLSFLRERIDSGFFGGGWLGCGIGFGGDSFRGTNWRGRHAQFRFGQFTWWLIGVGV